LRVVGDQRGGPTAAADIATACLRIADAVLIRRRGWGTYHCAGAPVTTWHDFAAAVFAAPAVYGQVSPSLKQINTADYKTAARRPANSELDCMKIAREFGIARPDWRLSVLQVVAELLQGAGRAAGGKS